MDHNESHQLNLIRRIAWKLDIFKNMKMKWDFIKKLLINSENLKADPTLRTVLEN